MHKSTIVYPKQSFNANLTFYLPVCIYSSPSIYLLKN